MQRLAVIAIYLVLMVAVLFGMQRGRRWAETAMSGAPAQANWQKFRHDVEIMNESSPVQRRVPKSSEPPALVLMRDHFVACTAIALVLSTALYASVAFFVSGILRTGSAAEIGTPDVASGADQG